MISIEIILYDFTGAVIKKQMIIIEIGRVPSELCWNEDHVMGSYNLSTTHWQMRDGEFVTMIKKIQIGIYGGDGTAPREPIPITFIRRIYAENSH